MLLSEMIIFFVLFFNYYYCWYRIINGGNNNLVMVIVDTYDKLKCSFQPLVNGNTCGVKSGTYASSADSPSSSLHGTVSRRREGRDSMGVVRESTTATTTDTPVSGKKIIVVNHGK